MHECAISGYRKPAPVKPLSSFWVFNVNSEFIDHEFIGTTPPTGVCKTIHSSLVVNYQSDLTIDKSRRAVSSSMKD